MHHPHLCDPLNSPLSQLPIANSKSTVSTLPFTLGLPAICLSLSPTPTLHFLSTQVFSPPPPHTPLASGLPSLFPLFPSSYFLSPSPPSLSVSLQHSPSPPIFSFVLMNFPLFLSPPFQLQDSRSRADFEGTHVFGGPAHGRQ